MATGGDVLYDMLFTEQQKAEIEKRAAKDAEQAMPPVVAAASSSASAPALTEEQPEKKKARKPAAPRKKKVVDAVTPVPAPVPPILAPVVPLRPSASAQPVTVVPAKKKEEKKKPASPKKKKTAADETKKDAGQPAKKPLTGAAAQAAAKKKAATADKPIVSTTAAAAPVVERHAPGFSMIKAERDRIDRALVALERRVAAKAEKDISKGKKPMTSVCRMLNASLIKFYTKVRGDFQVEFSEHLEADTLPSTAKPMNQDS